MLSLHPKLPAVEKVDAAQTTAAGTLAWPVEPILKPRKVRLPPKPKQLRGDMSKAWDYVANRGGCCRASEFDEDFYPIGPKLRYDLFPLGLAASTSGKTTIIYFDEP